MKLSGAERQIVHDLTHTHLKKSILVNIIEVLCGMVVIRGVVKGSGREMFVKGNKISV